jgi:DNA-binding transcriptional MerR regulator
MTSPETFPDHKKFSIGHLAQLTGVLPVTLRAWERRYGLIKPQRTAKGHRLYSDADVQQVLRILRLIEHGIPVGQVRQALLGTHDAALNASDWPDFQQQLLAALQGLHAAQTLAVLRRAGELYPLAALVTDLIRPVLNVVQASPASSRWAWKELFVQSIALYLHQRSQSVVVDQASSPILMCACLASSSPDVIQGRMFELFCRESGLGVQWLGHAPSPLAFADLLHQQGSMGGIVWQEVEPCEDWMVALTQLRRAASIPLAIGGDFALEYQQRLIAIGWEVLPLAYADALAVVRAWQSGNERCE